MADARDIADLVQARMKQILGLAELTVPSDKFERFLRLVFNEFDYVCFRKNLATLFGEGAHDGMGTRTRGAP